MSNLDPSQSTKNKKEWDPEGAMQALLEEREVGLDAPSALGETGEAVQARRLLREALPVAVAGVVQIALYGETEKMRFDAQRYIIDRNLGSTSREGDLAGSELDPIERLQLECVAYVNAQDSK